jgi:hypothetical protein
MYLRVLKILLKGSHNYMLGSNGIDPTQACIVIQLVGGVKKATLLVGRHYETLLLVGKLSFDILLCLIVGLQCCFH